jgi:hypothetical protein
MKRLGSLIAKYIVETYGPSELLKRLSDPFWFQAFNNVIGMDWDSSGSTTIVLYVLKSVFRPELYFNTGLAVLGGKGSDARAIPEEARFLGDSVDTKAVVDTSRLAARVDSVALQDGYTLYIHGLLISSSGDVLVIQQGMNLEAKVARRYHIYLEKPGVFKVDSDPHSGVASQLIAPALNLVDEFSREARRAILEIVSSTPTSSLVEQIYEVNRVLRGLPTLDSFTRGASTGTSTELREKVRRCPIFYRLVAEPRRVGEIAEAIKRLAPIEFHELLLMPGVGPETVRAIALVADLIYGVEPSLKDPTTHPLDPFLYAYAHGGKDGVPYRVKPREMDKTIEFFARVIEEVRAESREKELLLKNLSMFVRRVYRSLER